MKCDEQGNIWVTGPGGIWVISAAGRAPRRDRVTENTGNLAWGGEDWHTLSHPVLDLAVRHQTLVGPRRGPTCARRDEMPDYTLSADRCALIVQDLQNDVIIDGGAFAEVRLARAREGAERRREHEGPRRLLPQQGHPRDPRLVRRRGGRAGLKVNAPLFEGVAGALVRGT